MKKKTIVFVFLLILALFITLCLSTVYNERFEENMINTKSCIALSMDEALSANKLCNNMIGSDASNCIQIISSSVCPLNDKKGGVAENATLIEQLVSPS